MYNVYASHSSQLLADRAGVMEPYCISDCSDVNFNRLSIGLNKPRYFEPRGSVISSFEGIEVLCIEVCRTKLP